VAALIGHFLKEHGRCLAAPAGGFWEVATTVPSSRPTSDEHPLAAAIQMVLQLSERYEPLLTRGAGPLDHNVASDQAFELRRQLEAERVLLLDDTFTTGARAQSAASAINNGGGNVIAIVTVGRVIDPNFAPHVEEYWERQRRRPFDFATCCLD
jgi:hypothetical protein